MGLVKMRGTLTTAAASGAAWTGISQILTQSVRLVSMVILARLLFPEDFGVAAMVTVVTTILLQVVDLGFGEAIIQRKELTPSHISTAFWAMFGLGIIFCAATAAISPLFANFFQNELAGSVLAVSSMLIVIYSLGSVPAALLRKRLKFSRISIADIVEAVAYLAAAIPAAFAGFGVWSLVIGNLAGGIVLTISRWVLCGWHPSFTFSPSSLKDFRWFGVNVTVTRIIGSLGTKTMDYLIIGKFLAATTLGFYSIAQKIPATISTILGLIVDRVGLPIFSPVQDEQERFRRGFLKSVTLISVVILPLLTGLAVIVPEFIKVLFGEKWLLAILPAQILCIFAVFSTMNTGFHSILLAKGRPDINLKLQITNVVLLIPSLLIGVRFGATGVAFAVLFVAIVIWLTYMVVARRVIGFSVREYLGSFGPAVSGSSVMVITMMTLRYVLVNVLTLPDIVLLISSVIFGAVIYFITLKAIRTEALDEIIELLREITIPYLRPAMLKIGLLHEEAVKITDKK
jgi:O-antigen/teichoic acid export membrane protein